jgi:co-chaperonin GroES (HSP10)
MYLSALGDRIIVIEEDLEEQTETGIYLVGEDTRDFRTGKVISVGQGRNKNSKKPPLAAGDTVYYPRFAGQRVGYKKQDYVVLRFDEVLALNHTKKS